MTWESELNSDQKFVLRHIVERIHQRDDLGPDEYRKQTMGRGQGQGWLLEVMTWFVLRNLDGADRWTVDLNTRYWSDWKCMKYESQGFEMDVVAYSRSDTSLRFSIECKDWPNDYITENELKELIALATVTHTTPVLVRTGPVTQRAKTLMDVGRVIDLDLDSLLKLKQVSDIWTHQTEIDTARLGNAEIPEPFVLTPWWTKDLRKEGPNYRFVGRR